MRHASTETHVIIADEALNEFFECAVVESAVAESELNESVTSQLYERRPVHGRRQDGDRDVFSYGNRQEVTLLSLTSQQTSTTLPCNV